MGESAAPGAPLLRGKRASTRASSTRAGKSDCTICGACVWMCRKANAPRASLRVRLRAGTAALTLWLRSVVQKGDSDDYGLGGVRRGMHTPVPSLTHCHTYYRIRGKEEDPGAAGCTSMRGSEGDAGRPLLAAAQAAVAADKWMMRRVCLGWMSLTPGLILRSKHTPLSLRRPTLVVVEERAQRRHGFVQLRREPLRVTARHAGKGVVQGPPHGAPASAPRHSGVERLWLTFVG